MSGTGWTQVGGRWIRPDAVTGGPPPVPPRPPAMAKGLTREFLDNPLLFMQKRVVAPANGSVAGAVSTVEWALDPNDIVMDENRGSYEGATYRTNSTGGKVAMGQRLNVGQSIKFMVLKAAGSAYAGKTLQGRPGEVLPILADTPQEHSEASIPIYWLPWSSLKITEQTIPPVPSNLVDPPEDEYPRFFFTAGVNGCSVFARGEATSPTIYHAGLADKLTRGSTAFWRDQMAKAQTGFATAAVKGEVHKDEYMLNDPRERQLAEEFAAWLNEDKTGDRPFTVTVNVGFGCIFGIRYGRYWTLYLQENLSLNKVRFYKRSEVTSGYSGNVKVYSVPGSDLRVEREKTVVPRKLGKFSLGNTTVKTYKTVEMLVAPMRVVEFYPNRHWSGSFRQVVQKALG